MSEPAARVVTMDLNAELPALLPAAIRRADEGVREAVIAGQALGRIARALNENDCGVLRRELLEALWNAERPPITTRQLHDAIARRFPHRAGRKLQTVSTLVAELIAQGWVAGEKRGGTRWLYRPAVSRDQGLAQLARWVVVEFVREPEDRRQLVLAALRMVGFERRDS